MGEQDPPQPRPAGDAGDDVADDGIPAASSTGDGRRVANGPDTEAFDDPDEPGGLVTNTDDEAPSG